MDDQQLTLAYKPLTLPERMHKFYSDFKDKKIIVTSAFNTTSIILLHLIKQHNPKQVIYFLDTQYHFPETLEYKKKIIDLYQLRSIDLMAESWKHEFTKNEETYKKDPDFCCTVHKTEPLEPLKKQADVWVSGLMHWQNSFRKTVPIFETRGGILRFHPIIDMEQKQAEDYIVNHQLPNHPLLSQGYASVGCTHCTTKGQFREGRWTGISKTECGLHL